MFLDGKLSPGPMLLNGTVQGRIAFPIKTWYRTTPGGRSKPVSKLSLRLTGVVGKVRHLTLSLSSFTHDTARHTTFACAKCLRWCVVLMLRARA